MATAAGVAAIPAVIGTVGCGSSTLHTILTVIDSALAAADAFIAASGQVIPPPYNTYVTAALDGLNFVAGELQQTPALPISQVIKDALAKLLPLEVQDLTGLNPQQIKYYQAFANAILAVLNVIQAQAAPAKPAVSGKAVNANVIEIGWVGRMEIRSRQERIAKLRAKIK